jgi:hypothetical protein
LDEPYRKQNKKKIERIQSRWKMSDSHFVEYGHEKREPAQMDASH